MTAGLVTADVNTFLDTNYDDRWIKLHTGDPGSAGTANAAAGDTSRKQYTSAGASGGVKSATSIGPWTNGGTGETITHISFWTASSAGTFLGSAALTASKAWVSTDTFTLDTFSITVTPLAS